MCQRTPLHAALLLAALTLSAGTVLGQKESGPRLSFNPSATSADGTIIIVAGSDVKLRVQTQKAGAEFEVWYGMAGSATPYLRGVTDRNGEFSMRIAVPKAMHGLRVVAQAFAINDAGEYVAGEKLNLAFHNPQDPTDPVWRKQLAPSAIDGETLPVATVGGRR